MKTFLVELLPAGSLLFRGDSPAKFRNSFVWMMVVLELLDTRYGRPHWWNLHSNAHIFYVQIRMIIQYMGFKHNVIWYISQFVVTVGSICRLHFRYFSRQFLYMCDSNVKCYKEYFLMLFNELKTKMFLQSTYLIWIRTKKEGIMKYL